MIEDEEEEEEEDEEEDICLDLSFGRSKNE
jgi:hypothetical protein